MTDEQTESEAKNAQQPSSSSNETYSPVVVTDTVGAIFLGAISLILMAVVGGLLIRNHKLEERLRESDQ